MNETPSPDPGASTPPPPPPDAPPPRKSNAGLIIAICVGGGLLVLLVCGGLLAAVLLPAISSARDMARRTVEMSNLRQISTGLMIYASDNDGVFPPHPGMLLANGTLPSKMFDSPLHEGGGSFTYTGQMPAEPTNLKFGDFFFVYNWELGEDMPSVSDTPVMFGYNHDGEGRNVAFGDGHIEFMSMVDFETMITRVNAERAADPNLGPEIDPDALGAR